VEGTELEAVRAKSAAVFGNRHLAEVVAAAAVLAPNVGDQLTVRMLANRTGLTDSVVRPIVKRLVDADLLQPRPQQRPRGANYHEVRSGDGPWQALVHLCALLGSSS